MREFVSYFLVTVLIGMMIVIGASIALSIIGKASLINIILLLALLHTFSYFLLLGDYQKKFNEVVRIGIVVILLQIMLIGGAVIWGSAGISMDALFTAILVIGIYEIVKTKMRTRRLAKLQEEKDVQPAPKVSAAEVAACEAKKDEKNCQRA